MAPVPARMGDRARKHLRPATSPTAADGRAAAPRCSRKRSRSLRERSGAAGAREGRGRTGTAERRESARSPRGRCRGPGGACASGRGIIPPPRLDEAPDQRRRAGRRSGLMPSGSLPQIDHRAGYYRPSSACQATRGARSRHCALFRQAPCFCPNNLCRDERHRP